MSNNSQWNSFQSPSLNSDLRLYQYQSLFAQKNEPARSAPHMSTQSNNMMPFNYPSSQTKRSNGLFSDMDNNTFSVGNLDPISYDEPTPIGNFPPIDVFNADMVNEKSTNSVNSTRNTFMSNDMSNNQGTLETGIIEKLLVSYLSI